MKISLRTVNTVECSVFMIFFPVDDEDCVSVGLHFTLFLSLFRFIFKVYGASELLFN